MKIKSFLFVFLVPALLGCAGVQTTEPPEYYTLEYTLPASPGLAPQDAILKLERFSTVQVFSGTAMRYRTAPFLLNAHYRQRWSVGPGDLVTDCLLRDLRAAGLFRAVFSYRDTETARYRLEGTVTEFFEDRGTTDRKAVLSLNVTLLDMSRGERPERILFQKSYSQSEPIGEKETAGLARGMSRAMKAVSEKLIRGIRDTLQKPKEP